MSTEIGWTDETWNPSVGCSRVSPGCDHCYAITVAARQMQPAHVGLTRNVDPGDRLTRGRHDAKDWTGEVRCLPDRLETPDHWRKPRRVFVDSMSDLFHPDIPVEFIQRVWNTMSRNERHTFQVLTKRPQRMAQVLARHDNPGYYHDGTPPANVWVGTSVEDQRYTDLRVPHLLATPAAVRFLSIEPLLGPIDLARTGALGHECQGPGLYVPVAPPDIDWVIVGGESGPGHRTMDPEWAESIAEQCTAAGVPLFVKQDSGARSGKQGRLSDELWGHKEYPSLVNA